MICLTGDIHHKSLQTEDQEYLSCSEVEAAREYVSIAEKTGIKASLFATGKSVKEETREFREILKHSNVELGGHTYYAFRPKWLYNGIFSKLLGLSNGPRFYQDYEIKKTIKTFKQLLDVDIISWRDHAYRYDKNTYELLSQNGIKFISDEVDPKKIHPSEVNGLTSVPINVMPDHDHIYHGEIKPETVESRFLGRSSFPPDLYSAEDWLELVENQISSMCGKEGTATILAHPACMKIIDDFEIFRELCDFLASYNSVFISEINSNY